MFISTPEELSGFCERLRGRTVYFDPDLADEAYQRAEPGALLTITIAPEEPGPKSVCYKMLIAVTVYYFVFYVCLTRTTKDISGTGLWVERICVLMIMLAGIAIGSNYLNVQRLAPFHSSDHRGLRIAGVLLLFTAVTGGMFLITIFVISMVFIRS